MQMQKKILEQEYDTLENISIQLQDYKPPHSLDKNTFKKKINLNFYELIGFEIIDENINSLSQQFDKINKFNPIKFHGFNISIDKRNLYEHNYGYILDLKYKSMYEDVTHTNDFPIIIPNNINFLLIATRFNLKFKSQIITLLNQNYHNQLFFFPISFTIEQLYRILLEFEEINSLKIISDKGLEKYNKLDQKKIISLANQCKYPVYSFIGYSIKDKNRYVKIYNHGIYFEGEVDEGEILDFINDIRNLLK